MTHEDANINIEVANASRDLAEAAKRDASSMKTVAVLTMAFLPATFFAALFSMPSMSWDDPDKLGLYFAFTLPVTLVIFGIWAGVTQRKVIKEVLLGLGRREGEGEKKRA